MSERTCYDGLLGAMFREQLDADAEIAALRAELERKEELSVCRRKLNEFEKGPRDEAK